MMRVPVVIVTIVVLLAGCAGFVQQESAEVVTPAAVPTDSFRYPPGVSDEEVIGPRLASAHARSLASTNYTLVSRQRITTRNGSTLSRSKHTREVATNSTTYSGQFHQDSQQFGALSTRIDYWTNGSIVAVRYNERENRPRLVRWETRNGGPVSDRPNERQVLGIVEAVELHVADRTDDGGVVLVGHEFNNPNRLITPLFVESPTNVSLQMRVRHDGTVEALRMEFDAERNTQPVRVTQELRVVNVGSTTVEKPTWVQNTTARSARR